MITSLFESEYCCELRLNNLLKYMSPWFYTARKRFNPLNIDSWKWDDYIQFSGFLHIKELITGDYLLCPNLVQEIADDDWEHIVNEDFRTHWFCNYSYLKSRVNFDPIQHNILAIQECPIDYTDPPSCFENCGFDILDSFDSISVLTNCRQFLNVFNPNEVNEYGLINNLAQAIHIAENLKKLNFADPHSQDCKIWQIARYIGG